VGSLKYHMGMKAYPLRMLRIRITGD